jgi:hypothetical protein
MKNEKPPQKEEVQDSLLLKGEAREISTENGYKIIQPVRLGQIRLYLLY